MKKNRELITIGELSKLTGVNAKSLRYYEKIGILRPAYIDPANDYRYYSYAQIPLVTSIQFYVNMDIPLGELHHFIDKNTQIINFREQISYGIEQAEQKLQSIKKQIEHAVELKKEIDRSDQIFNADHALSFDLPEKNCWMIRVRGELTEALYYSTAHRLLLDIQKVGGNARGCEKGILDLWEGQKHQLYVFADIDVGYEKMREDSRFFHIPAQSYLCQRAEFTWINDPAQYFPQQRRNEAGKIVILSELFNSSFDYKKPVFELRCSELFNG